MNQEEIQKGIEDHNRDINIFNNSIGPVLSLADDILFSPEIPEEGDDEGIEEIVAELSMDIDEALQELDPKE